MKQRYTDDQISQFAKEALRDGFCVLRDHFPKEKVMEWREACLPLLQKQIELEGEATSRGAKRYYVTFPFTLPFSDPAFYEDPDILAIVEILAGKEFVMCQLASDTPVLGSDFQAIHRDCPALFPETGKETPPYQLALNFPLVDVTSEVARREESENRGSGFKNGRCHDPGCPHSPSWNSEQDRDSATDGRHWLQSLLAESARSINQNSKKSLSHTFGPRKEHAPK